jgi:hypothetical protein
MRRHAEEIPRLRDGPEEGHQVIGGRLEDRSTLLDVGLMLLRRAHKQRGERPLVRQRMQAIPYNVDLEDCRTVSCGVIGREAK